jgi:Ca-activated chloride channel family protein
VYKRQSYAYAAQGSPAKLRMPLEAGEYELRFVQGNRKVLARRAIAVTGAEATLSAPETAKTGESVKVAFTGPAAGSGDYITVTEPDAEPSKYNDYYYASRGSPATVRMPLEAGEYEIRFVQGNSKVIARQTITVEAASATLNAKASAVAGETVSIGYTGPPANSGDFVTVAAPGDPDTKYNDYWYTSRGAPAKVRMPLEAGSYEIRFVQGNRKVIARRPVNVTAATATTVAPAQAAAKTVIDVAFTGPPHGAGRGDRHVIPGAGATQYAHYANTGSGSPAKLRMPDAPGTYEIRFVHGNKYVLARRTIQVTAP